MTEPQSTAEILAGYKAARHRLNSSAKHHQDKENTEKMLREQVHRLLAEIDEIRTEVESQRQTIIKLSEQLALDAAREPATKAPMVREILRAAAKVSGLTEVELCNATKGRKAFYWRSIIVLLSMRYTLCSSVQIGKVLGGRDHSTIVNSKRRAEERAKPEDIAAIEAALGLGET